MYYFVIFSDSEILSAQTIIGCTCLPHDFINFNLISVYSVSVEFSRKYCYFPNSNLGTFCGKNWKDKCLCNILGGCDGKHNVTYKRVFNSYRSIFYPSWWNSHNVINKTFIIVSHIFCLGIIIRITKFGNGQIEWKINYSIECFIAWYADYLQIRKK